VAACGGKSARGARGIKMDGNCGWVFHFMLRAKRAALGAQRPTS